MTYPENERDLVASAAEHIEAASVADGLNKHPKPAPAEPELGKPEGTGLEPGIVAGAAEYIAEAAVANEQVTR